MVDVQWFYEDLGRVADYIHFELLRLSCMDRMFLLGKFIVVWCFHDMFSLS